MTSPKPLDQFMDVLLASPEIQESIKERFGKESSAKLAQFQSGDTDELHDLLIDHKQEISSYPEETHQASDGFDVELWKLGPVCWLRANEFDDMGYFESLAAARDYAEEQFGPLDETDEVVKRMMTRILRIDEPPARTGLVRWRMGSAGIFAVRLLAQKTLLRNQSHETKPARSIEKQTLQPTASYNRPS